MIKDLVLSTFTGAGLLDRGFRMAGYCIVCTGDPLFGQEGLEKFHPPLDAFEGIIGGPPCQRWAQSHNLAGDKAQYPNLIPMFERIVRQAQPRWFFMENVTGAPIPCVEGYHTDSHKLYAFELGVPQRRYRRFTFGSKPATQILWPSGEKPPKGMLTSVAKKDLTTLQRRRIRKVWPTLSGASSSQRMRCGERAWRQDGKTNFTIEEYIEGFGLPPNWDAPALLKVAKFKVLGNAVPIPVAYQLAMAIRIATGQ